MEMVTVPITIPKSMAPYINLEDKGLSFEQNAMLLYPLVQSLVSLMEKRLKYLVCVNGI